MSVTNRAVIAILLTLFAFVAPAAAATTTIAQVIPNSATITGRVTGTSAKDGLGGATVVFDGPTPTRTTTDDSGSFAVTVAPGEYSVTVNKGGYQTGSADVVATGGTSLTVNVALTESSLENLQVIGRAGSGSSTNGAKFNISSAAETTLGASTIQQRSTPEIGRLVFTLPGVSLQQSGGSVIGAFRVRGTTAETKVQLDGHPVSSGVGGTFVMSFLSSGLIGSVDVLKGAGLNGPTAGESGDATVNFRTPDFSPNNSGFFQGGLDNYGGSFFTALYDANIGDKFSLILGKSYSGYRGNDFNVYADGLVAGSVGSGATATNAGPKIPYTGTFQGPSLTNNLAAYSAPFSSPQALSAELGKLRFKFSNSTSLQLEFIGFEGNYSPEGGTSANFAGYATLPQCLTKGVAASGAGCNLTSTYNAPQLLAQVGQPNTVPLYTFVPNTNLLNNNPNFTAEFRTTLGNDTILFRPYAAGINRLTDGSAETSLYGNGPQQVAQGSYQVISNANCQVQFIAPTAAGGAKGPCYEPGASATTPGYVVSLNGQGTAFPVTTNATGINCTAAAPCYTTETQQNNSGIWGFGSASTALEIDKIAGYTFSYVHPVANNIFNFSIDHYFDDTKSYQNDASPLVAGCAFTQVGGTAPANHADPGYQPGCGLIGGGGTNAVTYAATPIAVPETFSSITSIALTGQFQLTRALEFDLGAYYTSFIINGQQESPTFLASFVAAQKAAGDAVNTNIAPIVLSGITDAEYHFDPHFGLVWRPSRDVVGRFTFGSSVSIPYASQVSGLETVSGTNGGLTFTEPNPQLKEEGVVSTDIGADWRIPRDAPLAGTVLSGDIFNNVIHNAWLTLNQTLPAPPPGYPAGIPYFQTSTFNGVNEYSEGIEFSISNLPALGFGYSLATSFNRVFYLNEPPAYAMLPEYQYQGAQLYGQPYSKGYLNLQWAGPNRSLFRVGADYEGPGNSYNYTSLVLLDAGIQLGFPHNIQFLISGENITNIQMNTPYGGGILDQAITPPTLQFLPGGTAVYGVGPIRNIAVPHPLTLRFSLIKRL